MYNYFEFFFENLWKEEKFVLLNIGHVQANCRMHLFAIILQLKVWKFFVKFGLDVTTFRWNLSTDRSKFFTALAATNNAALLLYQ